MNFLNCVADVFDKLASIEETRPTAASPERPTVKAANARVPEPEPVIEDDENEDNSVEKRASDAYTAIVGSKPNDALRQKLAEDPELVEALQKVADESRRPDRLGGPSSRPGYTPMAKTAEERRQAAWNRFGESTINE
jgi:type II secretory pathway component HofQ